MFFDFIILYFFNNFDLCDEFDLPDYTVVRKSGVYQHFGYYCDVLWLFYNTVVSNDSCHSCIIAHYYYLCENVLHLTDTAMKDFFSPERYLAFLLLFLTTFSLSAQIRMTPHKSVYEGKPNTITFSFYDAKVLDLQNQAEPWLYFITDSITVEIRSPKVTEVISSIENAPIAMTFTDFEATNILITVRAKGYEELVQMCPLPEPIISYEVFLKKEE